VYTLRDCSGDYACQDTLETRRYLSMILAMNGRERMGAKKQDCQGGTGEGEDQVGVLTVSTVQDSKSSQVT
jgi:hypothetical protein